MRYRRPGPAGDPARVDAGATLRYHDHGRYPDMNSDMHPDMEHDRTAPRRATSRAAALAAVAVLLLPLMRSTSPAQNVPLDPPEAGQPIPAFIAAEGPENRAGDRQLAEWALAAWSQATGNALRFQLVEERRARVRLYWVTEEDGLFGEMRPIVVDGRRGAAVFVRPRIAGLGEEIEQRAASDSLFRDTIVYLTCLHELGHALGLDHTANYADIMFFFGYGGDIPNYFDRYRHQLTQRPDIARHAGLSPEDITRIRSLYGAVAHTPSPQEH